jgi:hypothetical protein
VQNKKQQNGDGSLAVALGRDRSEGHDAAPAVLPLRTYSPPSQAAQLAER